MVWFVLAGMAALAVLAALWPLLRPSPPTKADPAANEAAFYKAQLEEIRRDVERGLLPQGEAESARAEAARRLIAAASEPLARRRRRPRRTRLAAAALIAVGLPAIAFSLYARLGEPRMPDEPLASRKAAPQTNGEIEAAVAAVEARLVAKPDDGKGWAVIAPVYMRLERYADAAHAYAEALAHSRRGPLAARRLRRGSGRRRRRRGHRRGARRRSIGRSPSSRASRRRAIYLALAAEQDGKKADAIRAYEQLARRFAARRALGRAW